jgi:hypothetical protein
MRKLRRTGANARTSAGYARHNTVITVATDHVADRLLAEGGWEDAGNEPSTTQRVTAVKPATPAKPKSDSKDEKA